MLRQLLTVLAILTGLAAAGAPAQASVNDVASVRQVAAAEVTAQCAVPSSSPALTPQPPASTAVRTACPKPRPALVVPAVVLRADRALE